MSVFFLNHKWLIPLAVLFFWIHAVQGGPPAGPDVQEKVSLEYILNSLERELGVNFNYRSAIIKGIKVRSLPSRVTLGDLVETLNSVLKLEGLVCRQLDAATYVIYQKEKNSSPVSSGSGAAGETPVAPGPPDIPGREVSGTVFDERKEALPGVSIRIKGTEKGTITDHEGRYLLPDVTPGALLVFSFVGYETYELKAENGKSSYDVFLKSALGTLNELVVVGYGVQKKVSVTNAVSSIQGEELVRRPVSNLAQNFQGIVPGLTVIDNGGGPGKSDVTLRVRGITTLSGDNNPLVIVDGVEQRYTDINPDDVESVSILKDASSTAIYGSRAANGVLLITTKRATAGKLTVDYHGFYAGQRANNNPEHMELEDYFRMQNLAYQNVGSPAPYTEEYIQEYLNATDRYRYPLPYTMADAVLKTAPQWNHSLSVSGGAEGFKTRLSLRYQDQGGIIPHSDSRLSEIRLNTDFKIFRGLTLGGDINYRYVNSLAPTAEFSVLERLKHGSIFTVPKYPDGTYGISAQGQNALMYAEIHGDTRTKTDYIIGNLKADWQLFNGLTFSSQFSLRKVITLGKIFNNSYTVYDYYNPSLVRRTVPVNSLTESRNQNQEYNFNNFLTYTRLFGVHQVTAVAGYSRIEHFNQDLTAYRQGFYNNDIQSIGQGANDATKNNSGGDYQWGLKSYFGRINYAFKDRYLLEANARYDGSSRFTGPNRYGFFPSFSGGWRVSEEKFWAPLNDLVSELKLRGSWGKTGNQAVALYSYYPTLTQVSYSFDGVPVQGYMERQMTNDRISWETTTQTNIGADIQFLNNSFTLTIDRYYKLTDGILLTLPVPGLLGLTATAQNAGEVQNRGWEFALLNRSRIGKVRVNAGANFSVNHNRINNLAGTGPYITGSVTETQYINTEGLPISSLWGYKTGGLFQTQGEVDNYPTIGTGIQPGDVKYLDLNNDGLINANDMTYLGPTFPKFLYGGDFTVEYGNFALNLLFQGAGGHKMNLSGSLGDYGNLEGFVHKIYTDNYWTPENPGARFPRPTKFDVRNTHQNDRELLDASYLRLKNVRLQYHLPSSLARKIKGERASVYVSATNLLTFSELNEWNIDPESAAGRVQNYPQTSLLTLGVNLGF